MKNIYISGIYRILKNRIFILGCILAFVITLVFTANLMGMTGRFERMGCAGRMIFINIAMMAFFTIFVPLYTNEEYRDGTIRNKLVAGFSQKQVYLGILFSHITALLGMTVCYFLAGVIGGAKISTELAITTVILFFAMCGYISVMEFVAMRVQKTVLVAICAFVILNLAYNIVMIGNFFLAFILKGTAYTIGRIIYNASVFGQWLIQAGFADPQTNPGNINQLIISVLIVVISILLGCIGLNKRDLK